MFYLIIIQYMCVFTQLIGIPGKCFILFMKWAVQSEPAGTDLPVNQEIL